MQGTSCTVRFRPTDSNVDLSAFGAPTMAISQTLVYLEPASVSVSDGCVVAKLTEDETMNLTANEDAKVQVIFSKDDGSVYRTNVGTLHIESTIAGLAGGDPEDEYDPAEDENEEEDPTAEAVQESLDEIETAKY